MHRNTPRRLIPTMRSHSPSVISAAAMIGCSTPALLKAKSRRPNASIVLSSATFTSAARDTSHRTVTARPPVSSIMRAVAPLFAQLLSVAFKHRSSSEQLLRRDRQLADPLTGSVKDGVRDGRGDANHRDLADALYAKRVHVRIVLVDKEHVHDPRGVGVDRHRVFGEVGVRDAPVADIHDGMLHERHADAADHAADALAAGRLWVDDAARSIGADHPPNARLPEIRIDGDLNEHGPEGMHREALARLSRLHVRCSLDRLANAAHGVGKIVGTSAGERILSCLAAGCLN